MTITITEFDDHRPSETGGAGALHTARGNLPLHALSVRAVITGLVARTVITQGFGNPFDVPLEATYVFPLPDRAAVVAMTMTADGRTVVAELKERAQARQDYDDAIASGHRASIAEEERPDVFTMRVGNIAPGERVEVALTLVGPLPFEDGEATFRHPLVVAPRYIPGAPLPGRPVGTGYAPDTDAVPDASRITPPVLLPGFPNPVDLSIEVTLDPAGLPLGAVRSSLHVVSESDGVIRVQPGARVDRDFVLRIPYGVDDSESSALVTVADTDGAEGTFQLTVVPPPVPAHARPKDVVLLLDRSGSMQGWKIVAARRASARIVDTLGPADRFAVLTFDHTVESPDELPDGLVAATDRTRFRAVEHLSRVDARGGTELLEPLRRGLALLLGAGGERDRVLVLVTDGQVGNEDQLLSETAGGLDGVRVHTVGIDQAVNAGFLGRLAAAGGGRCELVESEDRLDDAMDAIHRRIAAPLVRGIRVDGVDIVPGTVTPARDPDLFPGVPLVIRGRFRGTRPQLEITGTTNDGATWGGPAAPLAVDDSAATKLWARAAGRDLEDAYVVAPSPELEQRIVARSLRFGVLGRFTAFVAIDSRGVTNGGELHRVTQPVELPAGWMPPQGPLPMRMPMPMAAMAVPESAMFGQSAGAAGARPQPFSSRRPGGRPARSGAAAAPDALAAARRTVALEVTALRTMPASEAERSEALLELVRRLADLLRRLQSAGADVTYLRSLLELLRDGQLSTTHRWEKGRSMMAEFAAEPAVERPFWKRR